jgi:hypothetical protein
MAMTQFLASSGIAGGADFLLSIWHRSRIRRSAIDSQYQQILDRRLRELREDRIHQSTLKHIAEQIRSILDAGSRPLCLPSPRSPSTTQP